MQAGWTILEGVNLAEAEFATRGWYMDGLPPRFRRYVGKAAHWGGRLVAYLHINFKAKCFKGPPESPKTCTTPGHSCVRKVVSYFRTFKHRENRWIHRATQTNLVATEPSEIQDLDNAPDTLRARCNDLVFEGKLRHRFIFCEKYREPVSVSGNDAG